MRLSGQIKKDKTAPVPLLKKTAQAGAGGAAAPSKTTPAFSPPAVKSGWFRLTDLIRKKQGMQSPAALLTQRGAAAPLVKPEEAPPAAEAAHPPAAKNLSAMMDSARATAQDAKDIPAASAEPNLNLSDLIKKKQAAPAPVPFPAKPEEKEAAAVEAPPLVAPSAPKIIAPPAPPAPPPAPVEADQLPKEKISVLKPAETFAKSAEPANDKIYEEQPTHIYEIARQFGIEVPDDRNVVLEQARLCLLTIFKRILQPMPEKYMIWPMVKSIASDINGIITSDATILSILHRYRIEREKLIWHSLYTAILAMDLAKSEKNLPCSLYEIGGAALLHDVGLLIETGSYNAVEKEGISHYIGEVTRSLELVRKIEVSDIVLTMIAQHHGRLDGKGYPKELAHATFERGSQMLAIANIFEHAVLDILAEKKEAESEAAGAAGIPRVFQEYRKAFDIDLLKRMISLIGFYPAETMVELNNHTICKVVKPNHDFPLRPVVQVVVDAAGAHPEQEKLIDLKEVKILSIVRALTRSAGKSITK